MTITDTAQTVLEKRYFLKDEDGNLLEKSWTDLVKRVSGHFGDDMEEVNLFGNMMLSMDALPNSPVLMNAGTEINSFSACYVLDIGDSIDSIFNFYRDAALIGKSGGGVGANYSEIRSAGSNVGSTSGVASGPVSFIKGQDALTEVIKQGGRRRGANMGILDVDHPDILQFIRAKDKEGELSNFNLSVRVSDEFMESVTWEGDILDPAGKYCMKMAEDRVLWDEMMHRAWSDAEPGILFGDTIERGNLVPHLGKLMSTNPCGEQPLLSNESCSLISINLSNHVNPEEDHDFCGTPASIKWNKLRDTTKTTVLFMNRVLDKSVMPTDKCQEAMEKTRKIGVGIMGLHDMLIQMGIAYDSQEGRDVAEEVMEFIAKIADEESTELGETEGFYGGYIAPKMIVGRAEHIKEHGTARRNAHLTTIAPTGTLSMLADCSSGCEPYYAPVTTKEVLGEKFVMPNKWFLRAVEKYCSGNGADVDMALDNVAEKGLMNKEVPKHIQDLFKGAEDIHWKSHIRMQAALQKHVDSSISKTINMPNNSTVEDVKDAYELAWKLGCKGVTIYRNGSRETQVLSSSTSGHDGESTSLATRDDGTSVEIDRVRSEAPHTNRRESEGVGEARETSGALSVVPSSNPDIYRGYSESTTRSGSTDSNLESEDELPTPWKLELEDELHAVRYRVRDKDGNKVYFTVCTQDDQPVEVFARLPEESQDSSWHTISRLVSLLMRYNVPLDDITKQLRKSSGSVSDTPSKLARILDKYKVSTHSSYLSEEWESEKELVIGLSNSLSETKPSLNKNNCPDCGSTLINDGGCVRCNHCGWERCH